MVGKRATIYNCHMARIRHKWLHILYGKDTTVQNSVVRIDAFSTDGLRISYYGQIEEIWELDYVLDRKSVV